MKKILSYLALIFSVASVIFLVGCGSTDTSNDTTDSLESDITGTWELTTSEDTDSSDTFEEDTYIFNDDGTYEYTISSVGISAVETTVDNTTDETTDETQDNTTADEPVADITTVDITVSGDYTIENDEITLTPGTVNDLTQEEATADENSNNLLDYFSSTTYTYTIDGDTLTLEMDGKSYTYSKVTN